MCLVRELESLTTPLGDVLTNELDCPLYCLSRTIFTTAASTVIKAVSMAHECTETCHFDTTEVPRNVERESFSASRLEYIHDFTGNLMYCLNVYCIT